MTAMQISLTKKPNQARLLGIILLSAGLFSSTAVSASEQRALSFYHTHTGERLSVIYWQDGDYVDSALVEINDFLADFRTGDIQPMDPDLLDLLHTVYRKTGSQGHFEVISAYRSPKTNAMLRSKSSGVASKSQHLHGKAIDVRLTDIPIRTLRTVAYDLAVGGVGYYEKSNFVHLDTGRFRTW